MDEVLEYFGYWVALISVDERTGWDASLKYCITKSNDERLAIAALIALGED